MQNVNWAANRFKGLEFSGEEMQHFTEKEINKVIRFHSSMPGYKQTPLYTLPNLSKTLGIGGIYVKDESERFGLNAFKGLGASFAMASHFFKKLSLNMHETDYPKLIEQVKGLSKSTFATVTAGNHGKGVAWAAGLFGQRAKIYMPKGTSEERLKAIQALGAEASITDLNYDDTVLHVAKLAAENNWVLMQDTAWEGYETVPLHIMQGYTTIVAELLEQFQEQAKKGITHVFLQAGVGSFAASIAAAIHDASSGTIPKIIIVEPSEAACYYESAVSETGKAERVHGDLSTMMAGLACGEPNPFGWEILKSITDYFIACDDSISAKGMCLLGNPIGEDTAIVSGESGAVSIGLLYELMSNNKWKELRSKLDLDETANVLLISTEGDTDPVNYKKIVGDEGTG